MFLSVLSKKFGKSDYVCQVEGTYLMPNKIEQNGVAQRGLSSYQVVNNATNLQDFESSYFDVANLIEVGAYNLLKPSFLSTMSNMDFADQFQNANLSVNE